VARVESQDQVQDQVQAQDQDPDPVRATPIVTGAAHSGNAGAPARTNGTSLSPTGGEGASRPHVDERSAAAEPAGDVLSRRERLEKIKRKVADAAKPQPRIHPVPADPARAAESVLGLVRDLELELVRAREREEALRGDLDDARRELGRTATEGRSAVERLAVTEKELEEKRTVLGELLGEMQALEEERDESVRRAQALAALDEERAKLLEELGRRADEEATLRAEREAEVERLSDELRVAGTEGARLRAAVGELARERDQLGGDLDRIRRERDDLAEAKKALEAVHAALAQARARLG
jgi:chromosome segregation ATPase